MEVTMDVEDIRQLLAEYEVKFIRLAFCDIFGRQKNIAIMADELEHALEHGVSFDASAIKGFLNISESDLLLFPDLDTFSILPWRPADRGVARFYCYITYPDRRPFEGDGRYLLSRIEKKSSLAGYSFLVGPECEFYLFETDEKGFPTLCPFDDAGYFDMAPLDRGENVRREICFALENMGIKPERSHHEHGPGQNEIDFRCSSPLKAADDMMTFKTAVKAIAQQHGLFASFMPKPLRNESGSGLHINLSLYEDNENLFEKEDPKAMSFMAGILRRMNEITAFANPLVLAIDHKLVNNREGGIADGAVPQIEAAGDMISLSSGVKLPSSLAAAVDAAGKSSFIRSVIPPGIVEGYLEDRQAEADEYGQGLSDYDSMIRRFLRFI